MFNATHIDDAHGATRAPAPPHRLELDWLRVLGMAAVFVIHVAEPFNPWDQWHVTNDVRSKALGQLVLLLAPWVMPLFMFLAGESAWFSLRNRRPRVYLRERILRIGVPLVLGVLVLVPPQVYAERRLRGQFRGSFLDFLPHAFSGGLYPRGNLSWHHLWFLAFLLLFAIVTLPLFTRLRSARGEAWIARTARIAERPLGLLWLALPVLLLRVVIEFAAPDVRQIVDDWSDRTVLLPIYVFGFFFAAEPRFARALDTQWAMLLLFAGSLLVWPLAYTWADDFFVRLPAPGTTTYVFFWSAYTVSAWCATLGLLGLVRAHHGLPTTWLSASSAAVEPFYLVHQPVIVAIAAFLIPWPIPIYAKFTMLLLASLGGSVLATVLLGQWRLTRAAFGVRQRIALRPVSASANRELPTPEPLPPRQAPSAASR